MRRRNRDNDCLVTDLPNKSVTRVMLLAIKPDSDSFSSLTRARKLAADVRKHDPAAVTSPHRARLRA